MVPRFMKSQTFLKEIIFLFGLFALVLILSTACVPEKTPISPTNSPTIEIVTPTEMPPAPTEEGGQIQASPTPKETEPPGVTPRENIQYHITAQLDFIHKQVFVEETIRLPHPGQGQLMEIMLVVPPNAWLNVFSIQSIKVQGIPLGSDYSLEGVRLTIPLEQPWLPGEIQDLSIQYKLILPILNAREGYGPSPFGYTTLQTNLVDWYPMIPPYQEDEGWVAHNPWIFGEYLVYPVADFQVSLEILNGPDLVVAASAEAQQDGTQLIYTLEEGRNFVFSISPDYQVLEREVNGTKVYGYVFTPYLIPGQAAFNTTIEALSLYSELFGPYKQSSLSMVQADFNHGMEYEGLYFQSRGFFDTYNGSEQSYLVTIAAHETAHQWWYGQVANDQALEPWLDEALCTFSELLYYEKLYPDSVDWWWTTRVNYYKPSGVINRSIYDYSEYTDQYLAYRNATYLQGAKFLDALRKVMGDEIFFVFLREYAGEYKNQITTGEDFFSLLNSYLDLNSLVWLPSYFQE